MSQAVLVRGHLSRWINLLRLVGPLVASAGAAVALFAWGSIQAAMFFVVGTLFTLVVEIILWNVRRIRRWVEDKGSGFVVTDRLGVQSIADEQVVSLAYYKQHVHSEGLLKGDWRYFLVWLDGAALPIEMMNYVAVGENDPLSGLITRLLDKSLVRATQTLERGGQINGDGWTLDKNLLLLPGQPLPEQVRFDELSAVDVFDNELCIWRRGIDEAIAKLPQRSRDAHLLHLLLAERIQTPADASPVETDGLGRVLFERRPSKLTKSCLWLGVPVLLVLGLFCALIPDSRVAGIGMLALSPFIALVAWHCQIAVFRCHERGVFKRGLGFTQQLRYGEVAALTYSATRHYHNGAYVGTNLVLRFDPLPGVTTKAIAYHTTVKAADDSLDALRDHISRVLAARMRQEIAEGRAAVWTTNLSFSPEGIIYRPNALFGRKDPILMPFERFGGYDFDKGSFRLWEKENPKPVVTEASSQKNFYPGYFLLLDMFYGGKGAS